MIYIDNTEFETRKISILYNISDRYPQYYFNRVKTAFDVFEQAIQDEALKKENVKHSVHTAELLSNWGFHPEIIISGLFHHIKETSFIQRYANNYRDQIEITSTLTRLREVFKELYYPLFGIETSGNDLDKSLDFRSVVVCLASALARVKDMEWKAFHPSVFGINYSSPLDENRASKIIFSVCVPVTHMLRLDAATRDFEDSLFRYAYQGEYDFINDFIKEKIDKRREEMEAFLYTARVDLEHEFREQIRTSTVEVTGRVKHNYSIYLSLLRWLRQLDPQSEYSGRTDFATDLDLQDYIKKEFQIDDLIGLRVVFKPKSTDGEALEREKLNYVTRCIKAFRNRRFQEIKRKINDKYDAYHKIYNERNGC